MNITELAMLKKMAGDGSGSGGSGGGLSIKQITFTDRPTLYAWLQDNHSKVIKTVLTTQGNVLVFDIVERQSDFRFMALSTSDFRDYVNQTATWIPSITVLCVNNTFVDMFSGQENTELPMNTLQDEYWAAMSASLTVYYIE